MDKFVTVKKPSSVRGVAGKEDNKNKSDRQKFRYNPYGVSSSKERSFEDWKDKKRTEKLARVIAQMDSSDRRNMHLQDPGPLTEAQGWSSEAILLGAHEASTEHARGRIQPHHELGHLPSLWCVHPCAKAVYETAAHVRGPADHICSAATGHQRGEGRGPQQPYVKARFRKLAAQLPEKSTEVLRNVRIYINGYLDNTTDIEMKRIVSLAGGQVMCVQFDRRTRSVE